MASINNNGWTVHGSVALPEIEKIVDEDKQVVGVQFYNEVLLPPAYLDKPFGRLRVMGAGQSRKIVDARRAFDGGYVRATWSMGDDFYTSEIYGIEAQWDNMEAKNNASVKVNERATAGKIAVGILLQSREARAAERFFDESVFDKSDQTATRWDNPTNLTTIKAKLQSAVENATADGSAGKGMKKKFGINLDQVSMIMHRDLVEAIADNIGATAAFANNVIVPLMNIDEKRRIVRSYFGVKEVISVSSHYNQAYQQMQQLQLGQANFVDIYNRGHVMLGVLCTGGTGPSVFEQPGIGVQTVYSAITKNYALEEYPEPKTDGYVVRAKEQRGFKIRPDWGFLFYGCMATVDGAGHVGTEG